MRHHRIRYYTPADYTNGSQLDTLVKQIIRKTAAYEVLEGSIYIVNTVEGNMEQSKLTSEWIQTFNRLGSEGKLKPTVYHDLFNRKELKDFLTYIAYVD